MTLNKSVMAGAAHWQKQCRFRGAGGGLGGAAAAPHPRANQESKDTTLLIIIENYPPHCPIKQGHPRSDTRTTATGYLFCFAEVAQGKEPGDLYSHSRF